MSCDRTKASGTDWRRNVPTRESVACDPSARTIGVSSCATFLRTVRPADRRLFPPLAVGRHAASVWHLAGGHGRMAREWPSAAYPISIGWLTPLNPAFEVPAAATRSAPATPPRLAPRTCC